MEATVKNYPKFFLELKVKLKSLIKKNKIRVLRKKYRSNVGRAWADEKAIRIPIITDIESVYVVLHEIGHVVLQHVEKSNKPLYLAELEAELFALAYLRKWNIHKLFNEDYKILKIKAQNYIRLNIIYTIQRSIRNHNTNNILQLKHVHLVALKFSQLSASKNTQPLQNVVHKRKRVK